MKGQLLHLKQISFHGADGYTITILDGDNKTSPVMALILLQHDPVPEA